MAAFECDTLGDYIARNQVDGVYWKADRLLGSNPNPILKNDLTVEVGQMLARIPGHVAREAYAKKIGEKYGISWPTFRKVIEDCLAIHRKKDQIKTVVRKNEVTKLNGSARTWPFFVEQVKVNKATNEETFTGISIDKLKFVQMLASFGFTRYEINSSAGTDAYSFVKLEENVIRSVSRDQIIDYIEEFVQKQYDFDGAKCQYVNAEILINKLYDNMNKVFSKDLFARVRTDKPIIVNRDTKEFTFFYFKNGFVRCGRDGYQLLQYDQMEGSVWNHQLNDRNFTWLDKDRPLSDIRDAGVFADFCWRIAGEDAKRFRQLCGIIGYITHDFYEDKLKAILFTDSSLSEHSEGRTGKTLLAKMIGRVRSYCEINGKSFRADDPAKYTDADIGTQVMHLNDIKHRGRNRFDFEDVFNDITEGYMVKKLYMQPFRQFSKWILSSNRTLNIQGASQRDRIVEFEVSSFFGEHRSPQDFYKQWFGRDWDDNEWSLFDNFICFCATVYHEDGLMNPDTINLQERKLMNHTSIEFIEFMEDVQQTVEKEGRPFEGYAEKVTTFTVVKDFTEFEFDKKQLYDRFLREYEDFKPWLTQRTFNDWLRQFASARFNIKDPMERRSNGCHYIRFKQ